MDEEEIILLGIAAVVVTPAIFFGRKRWPMQSFTYRFCRKEQIDQHKYATFA